MGCKWRTRDPRTVSSGSNQILVNVDLSSTRTQLAKELGFPEPTPARYSQEINQTPGVDFPGHMRISIRPGASGFVWLDYNFNLGQESKSSVEFKIAKGSWEGMLRGEPTILHRISPVHPAQNDEIKEVIYRQVGSLPAQLEPIFQMMAASRGFDLKLGAMKLLSEKNTSGGEVYKFNGDRLECSDTSCDILVEFPVLAKLHQN